MMLEGENWVTKRRENKIRKLITQEKEAEWRIRLESLLTSFPGHIGASKKFDDALVNLETFWIMEEIMVTIFGGG